ncbi:hypothetical protein [Nonomuraea candida]|uniref:hypothetical protein n=1 Tax=Nonomuraea candida TaxID=359159 RepID=UPI0005B8670C|nr:hypothetical protein [Nonomuraea candida]
MEPEPLTFDSPEGDPVTWEVEAEPWHDPFERRLTLVVQGVKLVQRRVPRAAGRDREHLYDLLENEARMGARLLTRLRRAYPPELPRLLGYSLDEEEPFVLLSDYRGEPVSRYFGALLINDQRALQVSLLRAVRILSACGIVHRRIEPATVRWDGSAVQLTDLSHAALAGTRRLRMGRPPYACPAQREGTGLTATSDDLWSAGMVIYRTVTGREITGLPDLSATPALQPLNDVFSGSPPSPQEVLARLRTPDPMQSIPVEQDLALEEGRAAFDRARAARREPVAVPESPTRVHPVAEEEEDGRALPWWARWAPLAVLIVLLVVLWAVTR